jgi:1-acyl-sn-glycerol-3-phosphate acyltransferase
MALGALAANPNCGLTIVPCGMNYFHAHKFRSRAVIEFGSPVDVPPELVEMYKTGERREAVRRLLETVYQALVSVTVTSPDYDTLMVRTTLHFQQLQGNARADTPRISSSKPPVASTIRLARSSRFPWWWSSTVAS